jgi:type IV pilus biogenesis/stability protein PilW
MKKNLPVIVGCILFAILLIAACASTNEDKKEGPELDPAKKREAEAARNLGEAYYHQERHSAALKEFLKAEKIDPNDKFLQNDLGLVYKAKKRYDQAIYHFKRALEIDPEYSPARNNLGNAYMAKKDYDAAIIQYREVTEDVLYLTPHYPLTNMGLAYMGKKNYKRAEQYFLEALEIEPNYTNALLGLAKTYIAQGRVPEAIVKLEKAVKRNPESAYIHFELAEAYRTTMDFRRAHAEYETVITLNPDSELADRAKIQADRMKKFY